MSSLLGGAESAVQQTLRTLLGELERTCSDNEPAQADADAAAAAAATGRSLRVPNHLLAALAAALPDPQVLVMALDLVDRAGSITVCAAAASDRRFFQVAGSSGRLYLCLPESSFCECPSFAFSVLRGEAVMCKHVLAARIASAIGAYDTRMLTETEFSAYLCA